MSDIISADDLASYLRLDVDYPMAKLAELANGVVSETGGTVTDPPPTRLVALTLEVAARAYRNPGGFSSETLDDYTYRLPTDTRHAGVYLTDAERREVETLTGLTSSRRVHIGWLG